MIKRAFQLGVLLFFGALSTGTWAASQDECAIWLCLPSGFSPAACAAAQAAMIRRVTHFPHPKPALPPFHDCEYKGTLPSGDESEMTSKEGPAAYIPTYKVCTRWSYDRVMETRTCIETKTIPTTIVKNSGCMGDVPACTNIRYAQTYMDGQPMGEAYFFDTQGRKYTAPVIK